ncbi:TlpA family protein disulfide reductase [Xanthomarina sp. F2636L]|uniref:TlpA family protein disulfide reductase n=1 Tax=Xanthomarina sp. F2636L TaxID=2996018 RepID=UPI00225E3E1B|nr:hypothetical protein [Xanthomarina sp. F2636L]MCX7552154.1 hypothetical protein [Xanthomarina sp. F2636L]
MKYFCLLVLFGLTLVSCKKDSKQDKGDVAYIGGEIINPSNNYVVLLKANSVIDTMTLDSKNRFIYKLDQLNSGLYTFSHGGEIQMVLLEPNDSIMLRLNTMDFDESLVFTGNGAKKNNYLINLFLDGEVEDKIVLGFSQLPATDFEEKLDSLKEKKLKKLQRFVSKQSPSELFIHLAKSSINYDYYLSKEVYPFVNYAKNERKNFESLSEDFYSYRKDINYNDSTLVDYFPYSAFLKNHFENLALFEHFKHSNDSLLNKQSLEYNLIRLNLIDSLMTNENIKNSLLVSATLEFISNSKDLDKYDEILNSFLAKNESKRHKEYVSKMVSSLKDLKPGNPLPDVKVFDIFNNEFNLRFVLGNKPCVIFFWSQSNMIRVQECHDKVNELKIKYPEINFIGINANNENKDLWKATLEKYKIENESEYIFKNPKEAKQALAIYPINKVIILDKKGLIENSHANMFSINFEEELLGVINQ